MVQRKFIWFLQHRHIHIYWIYWKIVDNYVNNKYVSSVDFFVKDALVLRISSRSHSRFVHVAVHGTEIQCESVGSAPARKWPRECTSDGVITIRAHRLRRQCRSMIAMDGRAGERRTRCEWVNGRERKMEGEREEKRERERESVNRREAKKNSLKDGNSPAREMEDRRLY